MALFYQKKVQSRSCSWDLMLVLLMSSLLNCDTCWTRTIFNKLDLTQWCCIATSVHSIALNYSAVFVQLHNCNRRNPFSKLDTVWNARHGSYRLIRSNHLRPVHLELMRVFKVTWNQSSETAFSITISRFNYLQLWWQHIDYVIMWGGD